MTHDQKVARVAADVRARARSAPDDFVSIGKAATSHFVPNPRDPRHRDKKIDIRDMNEILSIDAARRTCAAEAGVTFSALTRATLALGLAPKLVPELETITVGGAVSGCSVESMSFRHGGFHDSCLAYEIVTGTGEVLRCSRRENPEIFGMIHGSYGTLGILTKVEFELVPAKPFVRMGYRHFNEFAPFRAEMLARCKAGDVDFIDAIVHGRDHFVLCLGRFSDDAGPTSSYTFLDIYFESTRHKREDTLTTYDYFFRYDTDCHWLTKTLPGMTTWLGRLLAGKLLLGSTNILEWSRRLRPILKYRKRPPVVVDLFVPQRRFGDFFEWYEDEIDYYPLWIVPYRMPEPYPWIAPGHLARMNDGLFIDCAIYGMRNDIPGVDYYRILEDHTFELDGIKTLISENHYDEERFWSIYHRAAYDRVKRRTDPRNLFRGLYEKFHYRAEGPGLRGTCPGARAGTSVHSEAWSG
jgi:FAD/FMN-containing dehydrogenase